MSTGDAAAVEVAHHAFYRAMRDGDPAAMASLWARTQPVSCVHPGTPNLHGYKAVVGSWSQILARQGLEIRASALEIRIVGEAAVTTCVESIGEVELAVTNVFVREGETWRILHHHSSPVSRRIQAPPSVVH